MRILKAIRPAQRPMSRLEAPRPETLQHRNPYATPPFLKKALRLKGKSARAEGESKNNLPGEKPAEAADNTKPVVTSRIQGSSAGIG